MDYYEKYLKYKNKYNSLKNLHGGMKIVINDIVSRDSISIEQFENIFIYATNVEIVSVNSLIGFIVRITLPENYTPFRSDIIDVDNKLMNLQINMLPTTGVKLVDIIFKICIIQEISEPRINNYESYRKYTCTLQELTNEYFTQRKIYDTSMMNGGIPVCPDVISLLTFSNSTFNSLFINDQDQDQSNLSNIFSTNPVFQYINREVNNIDLPITRTVGIILMESLPPSFKPLYDLKILEKPYHPSELFIKMAESILTNYLIIFFRSGLILLDAHVRNWMYDNCQQFNQFKVKAIDFGNVVDRNTEIDKIVRYSNNTFSKLSLETIRSFATLMGCDPSNINNVFDAVNIIREEIIFLNCLIKNNPDGKILWQPDGAPPINIIISDTKVMQIDSCMILIHRILVLSAYIGCFYNISENGKQGAQMIYIFNVIFKNRCEDLKQMINFKISNNLTVYLNFLPTGTKEFTISTYMNIKECIKDYLEPTPSRK
jgi:hypothetical protein